MSHDPGIPLDYGRPTRKPPSLRWLILLLVWTVGVAIWVVYFILIGLLLLKLII